jgi:hemoglobin
MPGPILFALTVVALLAGCSTSPVMTASPPQQDGEVPLPAGYRSWPRFLADIQRADVKQVREIYVNQAGTRARPGQPFTHGTIFVMENYAAQLDAAGQPMKNADGRLVKGNLVRVFVMSKGAGFGGMAEIRNGDWAYGAFDAAGNKTADNLGACRTCHAPLAAKDFVFRTDEYFAARARDGY